MIMMQKSTLHFGGLVPESRLVLGVAIPLIGETEIRQQRDQVHVIAVVQAFVHLKRSQQILELVLVLLVVAIGDADVV